MNMSEDTHSGQKLVLHPLELELQAAVSCQLILYNLVLYNLVLYKSNKCA